MKESISTKPYWDIFWKTMFSPQFHWGFLKARVKANLVDVPLSRRVMSIVFIVLVITIVTITHTWMTFLVAWVFPLTILYHISALCQICSEHLWGSTGSIESKSHGRFCGEEPPVDSNFKSWLIWWCKMLFYHLPVRVAILSDPEICPHDHHHKYPKDDKDWANAIYNRERQLGAGLEYHEYWGIHNAIDAVFQNLADQSPLSAAEIQRLIDQN
jgi:hypothetical protein